MANENKKPLKEFLRRLQEDETLYATHLRTIRDTGKIHSLLAEYDMTEEQLIMLQKAISTSKNNQELLDRVSRIMIFSIRN
jgi:hypothetical protein